MKTISKQKIQAQTFSFLTPLKRDELHRALSGSNFLMMNLIADWDANAKMIENEGHQNIKRLSRASYQRSQALGLQLTEGKPHRLRKLREQVREETVMDDTGAFIDLTDPPTFFMPQTFVSASFLLALTYTDRIVALPKGLREKTDLFPKEITDQIKLDTDPFDSEKKYLPKPQVAFIDNDCHPAMVEAFRKQNVQLFTIKELKTISDISDTLLRLGQVIDRPFESELLSIFMDAAMLVIDNHLVALQDSEKTSKRILFINGATNMLTGHLLERLLTSLHNGYEFEFIDTFSHEYIVEYNPDCLIVSTAHHTELNQKIQSDPSFRAISAVQNNQINFVDDTLIDFPSQYVVLAYYDLFEAICSLGIPV
jgi:iron complex transport system substrate-binding protein